MQINPSMRQVAPVLVFALYLLTGSSSAQKAPTTAPAAKITPEAKAVIDEVGAAYDGLQSLELSGTFSAQIDVGGEQRQQEAKFTSSFEAPNKFRHEVTDQVLIGSTGEKLYAYEIKANRYLFHDVPKEAITAKALPAQLAQLLQLQNPALLLALTGSAAAELTENVTGAVVLPDTTLDGKDYQTLELTTSEGPPLQLLFDNDTHFLRQAKLNLKSFLEARGAPDVKTAILTVDYATVTPDAQLRENQFAWTPPENAREATADTQGDAGDEALAGAPAPDFTLPALDQTQVSLKDLKGSVVVLDFWATWCGPCVTALPHLEELHKQKQAAGLKVFAVNIGEAQPKVQQFVTEKKLTMPVLLDTDNKVAAQYKVTGIPQTVLIGKDGVVRKVFVGFTPKGMKELASEVDAALAVE